MLLNIILLFSSVQSFSHVRLFVAPWTAAHHASIHHQLLELAQIHIQQVSDAIQPSHPLSSPSPPAFNLSQHQGLSSESVLHIRWPKYWSFSFSISPSNDYSKLISFRMNWLDLLAVQRDSQESSPTTVQKHQFFGAQLSLWSNSHIHRKTIAFIWKYERKCCSLVVDTAVRIRHTSVFYFGFVLFFHLKKLSL